MRHVLLIAWDFPPQGASSAIRAAKLCKYLPEFGWRPTVVCPDAVTQYDPTLLKDISSSVKVHRVSGPPLFFAGLRASHGQAADKTHAEGLLIRAIRRLRSFAREILFPDAQILWVRSFLRDIHQIVSQQQTAAIITTAPPYSLHLIGYFCKGRYSDLPWIADYQDYWSPFQLGWKQRLSIPLESNLLARADAGVFATETMRSKTLDLLGGLADLQTEVIPNGFDPDDFVHLPHRAARSSTDQFTLVYIGSLLGLRLQNEFFPALLSVCEEPLVRRTLRVRIIGHFANLYPQITEQLQNWGVLQVEPFGPYQAAIEAVWNASASLIIEPDTSVHPTKLFEYLAAGHPILAVVPEGEIAQLVRDEQAGVVVPPHDRDQIANALRTMVQSWQEGTLSKEPKNRNHQRFERREIAREMAELLTALTS